MSDKPRFTLELELKVIGRVRSPYKRRFGTPQQSTAIDSNQEGILELDPAIIPLEAVTDFEGIDRIWVISWLDRGRTWAPKVRPPRGTRLKRGVLATRSPDRPNPIGLSAVELIRVEGLNLHVKGLDLLDETPILDIKPYMPYADAFPHAKAGWIDEIPYDALQVPKYRPPQT